MNVIEFKYLLITPNIFPVHRVLQLKPRSQIFFTLQFKTKSIIQLIKDSVWVSGWGELLAHNSSFLITGMS